jgi:UDP-N-acetylglucosamine 2-epimerase (non-hydrolysing)
VDVGTNVLAGLDPDRMISLAGEIFAGKGKMGKLPEKWDGKAAVRAVDVIEKWRGA